MDNNIITIDKSKIELIKEKAGEITLTADAETELRKVLEFKKLAEDLYDFVQAKLGILMDEQKLKKIVAGDVVIRYSFHGERFSVGEATPEQFTKKVEYLKANTEEIDKYVDEKGELPSGVILKDRAAKASISWRNEL